MFASREDGPVARLSPADVRQGPPSLPESLRQGEGQARDPSLRLGGGRVVRINCMLIMCPVCILTIIAIFSPIVQMEKQRLRGTY